MPRILIPATLPYTGGFVSYGAACSPPDGEPRWGSFQFDWSTVTAATPGFMVDMTMYPNMPKQISTLFVDNSRSQQGVSIIFPDTGFTIVVSPFRRGFYSVLTKSAQFFVGITDPAGGTNSHTSIGVCDFFVAPQEQEVRVERRAVMTNFNPAASVGLTTIINLPDQFSRLKSGYLQLSNMTAGGAGFSGTFLLQGDGVTVVRADLSLAAAEFVDANNLWPTPGMEVDYAAVLWRYSWTVTAGALTAAGNANLGTYFDLCQGV